MASITIGQCVKGAWRDGILAIIEKPVFTLVIFALLLGVSSLQINLQSHATAVIVGGIPHRANMPPSWVGLACGLLQLLLICCLSIHVMRYCLIDAESSWPGWLADDTLWRYLLLYLALGLVAMLAIAVTVACVVGVAALLGSKGFRIGRPLAMMAGAVLVLALMFFVVFTFVRLSLLFCHTALGRKTTWRAAWNDSRGHAWTIVGTHVLTSLPMILTVILVFMLARYFQVAAPSDNSFTSWAALAQTIWALIGISIGAACSAWLYRRFAASILEAR